MTGSGGWPMTCFLTPNGEPFFCGTYFPQIPFRRLLTSVSRAWEAEQDRVLAGGADIVRQLHEHFGGPRGAGAGAERRDARRRRRGTGSELRQPARRLRRRAEVPAVVGARVPAPGPRPQRSDPARWRWSSAPARRWRAAASTTSSAGASRGTASTRAGSSRTSRRCCTTTACCCGTTCISGGRPARRSPTRVVRETAEFLLRDLRTAGRWLRQRARRRHRRELAARRRGADLRLDPGSSSIEVLGEDDGAWAARLFDVTPDGTFEHGSSVLQLLVDPADPDRLTRCGRRLLAARVRSGRSRPATTRSSPPGTGWRSRRWWRPVRCSTNRPGSTPPSGPPSCCATSTSSTVGSGGSAGTASSGSPAGVLDDYGAVAAAWLAVHQVTGRPELAVRRRRACSRSR